MKLTGDVVLIDKETEAARALADAIHAVYLTGIRVGVPPAFVARLMVADATTQMVAAGTHGDIPDIVSGAIKRTRGL